MERKSAKKSQQPSSSSLDDNVPCNPSVQNQQPRRAEKEMRSARFPKTTSLESLGAAQNNQAQQLQGRSVVPPRAAMPMPIMAQGGYGGTLLNGASLLRPPLPPPPMVTTGPARPNNEFLFPTPSQQGRRPWSSSPQGYSAMKSGGSANGRVLHAPPPVIALRPTNVQGILRPPPPPPMFPGSASNAPVVPNLKRKAPMQDEGAPAPSNRIYRPLIRPNIMGSSGQRCLYDKRFEASGIFVDPHLRIFNALRKSNGNGADPSKKPK